MGASPDGLVVDPSEADPHGLVEIKHPTRAETTSLLDLATKKEVCSSIFLDKHLSLKRNHSYYFQVQGQLHITCCSWCDFVVWAPTSTPTNLCIECIRVDHKLWMDTMFQKLFHFYMGSMLPEWTRPRHEMGQPVHKSVSFWDHKDLQPLISNSSIL